MYLYQYEVKINLKAVRDRKSCKFRTFWDENMNMRSASNIKMCVCVCVCGRVCVGGGVSCGDVKLAQTVTGAYSLMWRV